MLNRHGPEGFKKNQLGTVLPWCRLCPNFAKKKRCRLCPNWIDETGSKKKQFDTIRNKMVWDHKKERIHWLPDCQLHNRKYKLQYLGRYRWSIQVGICLPRKESDRGEESPVSNRRFSMHCSGTIEKLILNLNIKVSENVPKILSTAFSPSTIQIPAPHPRFHPTFTKFAGSIANILMTETRSHL
jgi:hypothetical protein